MRIFQRLREKFGFESAVLDTQAHEDKAITLPSLVLQPTDGMCCGHCSGKAEGHSLEQPGT